MRLLFLLLVLMPSQALAQQVTPNFTTGTMTQTVTATQTVNETIVTERFGRAVTIWNGDNVEAIDAEGASIDIATTTGSVEFHIVDPSHPWQLEISTRAAGLVETVDTTRVITTNTTTNTLSVFAQ